jgi:hypothetical protein
MRAQRDAGESYQENQRRSAANAEKSQMARLERRQDKKKKLPVKQSGSDRVTAGKTVTRPIDEWPVNKRAMPMNKNLQPLIQQHATRNGKDQSHQRWPPSFPGKKQHERTQNDSDPLPRAKLGECAQYADEHRREPFMKPDRNSVIGTPQRIPYGQRRREILGEKQAGCHEKRKDSISNQARVKLITIFVSKLEMVT